MLAHIEIDDILLVQARRVTGLEKKSELVNEALRQLVLHAQVEASETPNPGNEELLEDLEDIETALERLRNPGRRLTMEEAERELGLGG